MKYAEPLTEAVLLKRYKRFLADVRLSDGSVVVAHCPNSGSMKGCWAPNVRCRISRSDNPKRKLKYTLEQVCMNDVWIMVHTGRPNAIVAEAIQNGTITELQGYTDLQRERPYGREKSRIDILLQQPLNEADPGTGTVYVEVKNLTLTIDGVGAFPDAVTKRGTKHLRELTMMVEEGHRAVLVFHVGRDDCDATRPAHEIDPEYARTLKQAVKAGVEVLAYRSVMTETGCEITVRVPFHVD